MKEAMKYYVRLFMFLFPIAFLPIVVDSFGFGKNWLLLILGMVGMLLWVGDLLINRREGFTVNKLCGWGLLLVVWAWISWWREQLGVRTGSMMQVGGIGTLMAVAMWFFLWLQVSVDGVTREIDKQEVEKQLKWLTAAGILTAIVSVVVFLIPASKLPIVWPKNSALLSIGTTWSLTGSLLSEAILMLFLVLEWGRRLLQKVKREKVENYLTEAAITAGLTLVLFLDIYRIFKAGWGILDGVSAWVIAVEVFKRSPIWGIGIGNFWQAFSAYRPTSYNLTSMWAGGFKFSSMGILQLWTELGTVGLALVALMVAKFLKQRKNWEFIKVLVLAVIVLFLPVDLVAVMLLTWLLVGSILGNRKVGLDLKVGEKGINAAPWMLGVVIVGGVAFGGYWMYRLLLGDIFMRQSLVAAAKNDGGSTYNLQIKAIGMNGTDADYRVTYSQTNMALAQSVLSGKTLSDDDKQKASTLIQQAVREAKTAITLDQNNSSYWSNLALIYRSLIGTVDGSADWSFQAYQQAAALDPVSPSLKLNMGGLLYAAGNYEAADRIFEQVVTVKQDYANGWYNWAYSAKKMNDLNSAVSRLTQALALVPVDSGDYDSASKELDAWKKELDAATANNAAITKQAETLKTPEPLPTTTKPEKVNVPTGEMQPPATETPTPTASQSDGQATVSP
jgi:Tfp pilus assembly protein PilF